MSRPKPLRWYAARLSTYMPDGAIMLVIDSCLAVCKLLLALQVGYAISVSSGLYPISRFGEAASLWLYEARSLEQGMVCALAGVSLVVLVLVVGSVLLLAAQRILVGQDKNL